MAALTQEQLAKLRQGVSQSTDSQDWDKPTINAALQAVEDWFDKPAVQLSLKADIDAATAPYTFSNADAKKLVKFWLRDRFGRE